MKRKNEMKNQLGYWKEKPVMAIYKEDYIESDDIVVIWDDGKKVVQSGMEIGVLGNNGYIVESSPQRYRVKKRKPQKRELVGGEADYYSQFSKVVDEFFNSLAVGEEKKEYDIKITLGERKQLW